MANTDTVVSAVTPGPWTFQGEDGDGDDCTSFMVLGAPQPDPRYRTVKVQTVVEVARFCTKADAVLIAAAPALLSALRDVCDAIPDETLRLDPPLGAWVESARKAIAEAEGR